MKHTCLRVNFKSIIQILLEVFDNMKSDFNMYLIKILIYLRVRLGSKTLILFSKWKIQWNNTLLAFKKIQTFIVIIQIFLILG